jgi:hypothetical protein
MGTGGAPGAGLSLAATGFKVLGDYTSSRATAGADVYQSELLEQQAEYGRLKATQTNAQLTRNLAITLGHVDAVRSAMHVDPSSPTGAAVRGEMEEAGTERKGILVENLLQQTRMEEANAAYLRSAASNALLAGDIVMLGDAFSGAAGAIGGYAPGGAPGGGGGPSVSDQAIY